MTIWNLVVRGANGLNVTIDCDVVLGGMSACENERGVISIHVVA